MTICIVLQCSGEEGITDLKGLIFASDTQVTSEALTSSLIKIRRITGQGEDGENVLNMCVAYSGDVMICDELHQDLVDYVREKIIPVSDDSISVKIKEMRKAIGDISYEIYKKYRDREAASRQFEFIIGSCDSVSTILHVTCEGKTQIIENFKIIGKGRVTGGELLLKAFYNKNLSPSDAATLAALIINKVGSIDPKVGEEPFIELVSNNQVKNLTEKGQSSLVKTSIDRWDVLIKIWYKMANSEFKRKIDEII